MHGEREVINYPRVLPVPGLLVQERLSARNCGENPARHGMWSPQWSHTGRQDSGWSWRCTEGDISSVMELQAKTEIPTCMRLCEMSREGRNPDMRACATPGVERRGRLSRGPVKFTYVVVEGTAARASRARTAKQQKEAHPVFGGDIRK